MDLEQTAKDPQAQNSQFQQLLMTLAKGQEDLKALLEKNKEKNKKRPGVATFRRRFETMPERFLSSPQRLTKGPVKGKGLLYLLNLRLKRRNRKKTKTTPNNNILQRMINIRILRIDWKPWSCRGSLVWILKN